MAIIGKARLLAVLSGELLVGRASLKEMKTTPQIAPEKSNTLQFRKNAIISPIYGETKEIYGTVPASYYFRLCFTGDTSIASYT